MGFLGKLGDAMLGGIPGVLGSVVGAIGGAVQQNKEQKFNAEEAEKSRQFNAEEAEKARQFNSEEAEIARQYQTSEREATQQWNLEQWNRENEYNSPAAQMQRAVEAGLNPNSVAAGMSGGNTSGRLVSSPMSGAAASGSAASGGAASTPSVAGSIASLLGNSTNSIWQDYLLKQQAEGQMKQNAWIDEINGSTIKKINAEVVKMEKSGAVDDATAKQINEMLPLLKGKTVAEVNQLLESAELTRKQIVTEQAKYDNIEANTELVEANTDLSKEELKKKKQEVAELAWKNWFRENLGIDSDSNLMTNFLTMVGSGKGKEHITTVIGYINDIMEGAFNEVTGGEGSIPGDMLKKWMEISNPSGFIKELERQHGTFKSQYEDAFGKAPTYQDAVKYSKYGRDKVYRRR